MNKQNCVTDKWFCAVGHGRPVEGIHVLCGGVDAKKGA